MRLLLCGDVMTGRGVDQILRHPSEPTLHEPYMSSARDYVALVERVSGPVPRGVDDAYVWGEALAELARADARIINLETSITRSEAWEPKGINYRMHPENVGVLVIAHVDCCALANNHVLDYGVAGLRETLAVLRGAGIAAAGAGEDEAEAWQPAVLPVPGGRVLVFAFGHGSSGIPPRWAAAEGRPGVAWVADLGDETADMVAERVRRVKKPGDVAIASIHWGSNWGYDVPAAQVRFARRLVAAGVDLVHGHSSHHPRPIEVCEGRLILYGAGDLINDYEGISGHEAYRSELSLLYFPTLAPDGRLEALELVPVRRQGLQLRRAAPEEARWLADLVNRISAPFGFSVALGPRRTLEVRPKTGA
ncbi:MAG TPA: CapA family protein [Nannocystis sp.]